MTARIPSITIETDRTDTKYTILETFTNVAGTVALSGYYGFEIYLKYI
jgi:hypothetical protein